MTYYLTVEEHLEFAAAIYGVAEWRVPMDALLDEFELAEKRRALPAELSRAPEKPTATSVISGETRPAIQ